MEMDETFVETDMEGDPMDAESSESEECCPCTCPDDGLTEEERAKLEARKKALLGFQGTTFEYLYNVILPLLQPACMAANVFRPRNVVDYLIWFLIMNQEELEGDKFGPFDPFMCDENNELCMKIRERAQEVQPPDMDCDYRTYLRDHIRPITNQILWYCAKFKPKRPLPEIIYFLDTYHDQLEDLRAKQAGGLGIEDFPRKTICAKYLDEPYSFDLIFTRYVCVPETYYYLHKKVAPVLIPIAVSTARHRPVHVVDYMARYATVNEARLNKKLKKEAKKKRLIDKKELNEYERMTPREKCLHNRYFHEQLHPVMVKLVEEFAKSKPNHVIQFITGYCKCYRDFLEDLRCGEKERGGLLHLGFPCDTTSSVRETLSPTKKRPCPGDTPPLMDVLKERRFPTDPEPVPNVPIDCPPTPDRFPPLPPDEKSDLPGWLWDPYYWVCQDKRAHVQKGPSCPFPDPRYPGICMECDYTQHQLCLMMKLSQPHLLKGSIGDKARAAQQKKEDADKKKEEAAKKKAEANAPPEDEESCEEESDEELEMGSVETTKNKLSTEEEEVKNKAEKKKKSKKEKSSKLYRKPKTPCEKRMDAHCKSKWVQSQAGTTGGCCELLDEFGAGVGKDKESLTVVCAQDKKRKEQEEAKLEKSKPKESTSGGGKRSVQSNKRKSSLGSIKWSWRRSSKGDVQFDDDFEVKPAGTSFSEPDLEKAKNKTSGSSDKDQDASSKKSEGSKKSKKSKKSDQSNKSEGRRESSRLSSVRIDGTKMKKKCKKKDKEKKEQKELEKRLSDKRLSDKQSRLSKMLDSFDLFEQMKRELENRPKCTCENVNDHKANCIEELRVWLRQNYKRPKKEPPEPPDDRKTCPFYISKGKCKGCVCFFKRRDPIPVESSSGTESLSDDDGVCIPEKRNCDHTIKTKCLFLGCLEEDETIKEIHKREFGAQLSGGGRALQAVLSRRSTKRRSTKEEPVVWPKVCMRLRPKCKPSIPCCPRPKPSCGTTACCPRPKPSCGSSTACHSRRVCNQETKSCNQVSKRCETKTRCQGSSKMTSSFDWDEKSFWTGSRVPSEQSSACPTQTRKC